MWMHPKTQVRWGIVGFNGYIRSDKLRFTRADTIANMIAEHRGFQNPRFNGSGLTDAQFWRKIKRRGGYSARRIKMRVA